MQSELQFKLWNTTSWGHEANFADIGCTSSLIRKCILGSLFGKFGKLFDYMCCIVDEPVIGYDYQHSRREALSKWLMNTASHRIQTEVQEAKYKVTF